jgi:hypothetical protein
VTAIDKGQMPSAAVPKSRSPSLGRIKPSHVDTLGNLIDHHLADLLELRRSIGRSKDATRF